MNPITTTDLRQSARDFGAVAFGALALAALMASVPATAGIVAQYHLHDAPGLAQSIGALLVFEAGAFLSKIGTLFVPQWGRRLNTLQAGLLAIVFAANLQASAAVVLPAGWLAWAGVVVFAGLMPALQWVFLGLCVARIKALHDARILAESQRAPTADELAFSEFQRVRDEYFNRAMRAALARVQEALEAPAPALALPRQADYPAPMPADEDAVLPVQTGRTPACPNCGDALASWAAVGAAARHGHCPNCKEGV